MGAPRTIGVGLIGHGEMGRVHTDALVALERLRALPFRARLVAVCGRDGARAERAAARLGYERATTDWRELTADPQIDVVVNAALDADHAEPCLGALTAGKHVLCEKPLALSGADAARLAAAAAAAGTTAACGYNYRLVPAVALALRLVREGELGAPLRFRGAYLQDEYLWKAPGERGPAPRWGGATAGLSHVLDLMTLFAGAPLTLSAETLRLDDSGAGDGGFGVAPHREHVYAAVYRLASGALGMTEASLLAAGCKAGQRIELHGTRGALAWELEDLNRLELFREADERDGLPGARRVLVTERDHPFLDLWHTPGHGLGWQHSFVHQWLRFVEAVLAGVPDPRDLASFADAARTAALVDAVHVAAREGRRVELTPA